MTYSPEQTLKPRRSMLPSLLSAGLEKNLHAYMIAAGSAGVALMALAQPADAEIVYTKANTYIDRFGAPVPIDINGDGQTDFVFSFLNRGGCTSTHTNTSARAQGKHKARRGNARPPLGCGYFYNALQVVPQETGDEALGVKSSFQSNCANDLALGAPIGPNKEFAPGAMVLSGLRGTSEGSAFCPWAFGHHPYLAVKFVDTAGETHYGWVRISVREDYDPLIEGYAYETIPNHPIKAGAGSKSGGGTASMAEPSHALVPRTPAPATLGRLAQGAEGVAAWRREEEMAA